MTVIPFDRLEVHPAQRLRISARAILAITLTLALLPRIGFLARPFESDSGLYIYMGKVVAEGGTIYRDFYETKPPGVPLFCAGLYTLFGNAWWPYVMLQAAMTIAAAWLLAKAVQRVKGTGGQLATLLFATVFLNFSSVAYRGFQLETVQCFFASIAGCYAIKVIASATLARYSGTGQGEGSARVATPLPGTPCLAGCFWTGLSASLAGMLKPTGLAVAGAFLVWILIHRRHALSRITATTLGLFLPAAAVVLWTWRAGLMSEMPALFREIALYGSGTPLVALDWVKPAIAIFVAGFPFWGAWILRSGSSGADLHDRHGPQAGRLNGAFAFTIIWLILESIGIVAQKRMYIYHFLPLAPPLAVLFGLLFAHRPLRAQIIALAPILLLSLTRTLGDFQTLAKGDTLKPESAWLIAHAKPGDSVVGDPIERLLMETRLKCGSRYAHLFYFANHDDAPLEYARRFIEDIHHNRPRWAVFATDRAQRLQIALQIQPMFQARPQRAQSLKKAWAMIEDVLANDYKEATQAGEFTIYHRRSASLP